MTVPTELKFYATSQHDCGYLDGRRAVTVFADPEAKKSPRLYSSLARFGFRRSGDDLYVPHCGRCQACVPVRVDVDAFRPRRIHKRVLRRNSDLSEHRVAAVFSDEHFDLYRRYQQARHGDGSMAQHDADDYQSFLLSSWSDSSLLEMRLDGTLLQSPSLTIWRTAGHRYIPSEPNEARRSLGIYAILRTIELTRAAALPWLYLGYWIAESPKMAYKRDFVPQQHFAHGEGACMRNADFARPAVLWLFD